VKRTSRPRVAVLAGGVGAARLVRGLAALVPGERLTIVVNTGDDDVFHGLHVSPDIDTIVYTLAGLADVRRGWGLTSDSFDALGMLGRYGRETWFQLGDRDLGTHLFRSERLRAGDTLTAVTDAQRRALGVAPRILPMSDDPVRTIVETTAGRRSFQEYLVRDRARESVRAIRYTGARAARPAEGVLSAIDEASLVVIAPSNPFVSIGPILAVPGVRQALRRADAPIIAVSPLIGGRTVKGPADRMMRALGHRPRPSGLARIYADFLDGMVIDNADHSFAAKLRSASLGVAMLDTLMSSPVRSVAVARAVLELGAATERRRLLAS
jgi:LPPG:FO 2-phospho-L-lactate transferase